MASLRNIMNVDDDHVESHSLKPRESAPTCPPHPAPSVTASGYATAAVLSVATTSSPATAARSHRHSPPSYSLQRLGIDPSSSSSPSPFPPARPTPRVESDRRQSTASIDSMDSHYRHGHNHSHGHGYSRSHGRGHSVGSYPSAPMRPLVSGEDSPLKLTPITGRVSRAKKGLAVHVCEICRPPKTFTRAEHLRRHQLSHTPPELACEVLGCDKVFHRRDLLERHLQKHDHGGKRSKVTTPRQGTSARPRGSKSPGQVSQGNSPPQSMLPMPHSLSSPPPPAGSKPDPSHRAMAMAPGRWSTGQSTPQLREVRDELGVGEVKTEYIIDSMPSMQSAAARTTSGYSQPRTAPSTGLGLINSIPGLCVSNVTHPSIAWQGNPVLSSYSAPPSSVSRAQLAPAPTPSPGWNRSLAHPIVARSAPSPAVGSGSYPIPFGFAVSTTQTYPSMYGDGSGIPLSGYDEVIYGSAGPNAAVRSLSPQLALGPSSETLVTTPSALPSDRVVNPMACGRQPESASALSDLLPASLSSEVRSRLPVYIDIYWARVHPLYPIIHRATFAKESGMDAEHMDVLRCSMGAVATQFLQHREHRIAGSLLHSYASQKSVTLKSTHLSLSVMQATLLCEYYARFRGRSKESYRPSPRFDALCQMVANGQPAWDSVAVGCDNFQKWERWIRVESCRRLLAACFILSVGGIWYYEQPFTSVLGLDNFSPMMLSIPLSASTQQAWESESAAAWASIDLAGTRLRTVGEALQEVVSPSSVASMPLFDASLLLAAQALQLPRRRNPTEIELVEDASCIDIHDMTIPRMLPWSPGAYTYMALHYTPLHWLLSVSGDSWAFNKKISQVSTFTEYKKKLGKWQKSGSAAIATVFAAKALKISLNLGPDPRRDDNATLALPPAGAPWVDISDFWGIYVCALVCWAFGHEGKRNVAKSSRGAAVGWLLAVAEMEPGELQGLSGREESQGVVGVVHDVLSRDCLGGRSILYSDAVGVLRRLEEVGNWKWF
ncbi:Transcription factor [Drechmeria coniospora]|uniref:Transcription factor n=1 Tax=Drechmeria coniospora TaxID=98403 RepID=A0A151GIK0_DRECN|nr:Transcription factor [Drechmeria coniospora]KYK56914.1 Transcription factor [Drechmeria coniospora]ODA80378.1 hypothetical protein RJ55_03336 [Drechmeria coniospora]